RSRAPERGTPRRRSGSWPRPADATRRATVGSGSRRLRRAPEQPFGDAGDRLLAVVHGFVVLDGDGLRGGLGVVLREDGEREADARALQARGLVDETFGFGQPAALEEHVELGPGDGGYPPALVGLDAGEQ